MEVVYLKRALEDLKYWKKAGNKKIQQRITALIDAIEENPYHGIGKPELLKYDLSDGLVEFRGRTGLFMKLKTKKILIYSLKGHY